MCVLSINLPIRKKAGNLSYALRVYIYIYIYSGTIKLSPLKRWQDSISVSWKPVSFFVAEHLLVGQLCTNSKSDRSFYHVWKWHNAQRARSEIALLYKLCYLPIQVMTIEALPAPSKCKSGRFNVPRVMKTKFPATVMVFGVVSSKGHIITPHLFEVGLKVNTKMYMDVLNIVVIPWCNQVAGSRPWVWQQDSAPAHKSQETVVWLQKECYDFVPFSHWPPSFPTLTRWTTSFVHTSRTSTTWHPTTPKPAWSPPSADIRWDPAGACGKGMLQVPDSHRGGDWVCRRLHWIDVSSTT